MEEGDLMDRVPILLQRDRQYYDVGENSKKKNNQNLSQSL